MCMEGGGEAGVPAPHQPATCRSQREHTGGTPHDFRSCTPNLCVEARPEGHALSPDTSTLHTSPKASSTCSGLSSPPPPVHSQPS